MSRSTEIVFCDTETLGLDRSAPVWEFAAIRVTADGQELVRDEFQIRHEPAFWPGTLLESFRRDYEARYDEAAAVWPWDAAKRIQAITEGGVTVAGSNPGFDVERLLMLLQRAGIGVPNWHYHPLDIPSMVEGYLAAVGGLPDPPFKSDQLSTALGVSPADFARHTALGDCEWTLAQWRLMRGVR